MLDEGRKLPLDLKGKPIYYVGPAPNFPGHAVGSSGPPPATVWTSTRRPMEKGLNGMIGKGIRNEGVIAAMKKYGTFYFGMMSGVAALILCVIVNSEVIIYEDLSAEIIQWFVVKESFLIVLIDCEGMNMYKNQPGCIPVGAGGGRKATRRQECGFRFPSHGRKC